MNNASVVESIADFVLRNFDKLPVYAEVHGEKRAFKTVDDALRIIESDQVSSFVLKDKKDKVIGEIHVDGLWEEDAYTE